MNRKYSALAVSAAAVGMVLLTSTQASADPQPRRTTQVAPSVPSDWPDEGKGYPAQATTRSDWPDEGTGYPKSVAPKKGWRYAPYLPEYATAPTKTATTSEYPYSNYDPKYEVARATTTAAAASSRDDTTTEVLQSGASALGGAAVALSCVWLYRRHQLRAT